jgi:hypothetical protein
LDSGDNVLLLNREAAIIHSVDSLCDIVLLTIDVVEVGSQHLVTVGVERNEDGRAIKVACGRGAASGAHGDTILAAACSVDIF